MSGAFHTLEDVVAADGFPDVDMALRRGRHVDRDDGERYAFITDAQAQLELFYRRFGCELIHKPDGYFYLLPTDDRLGRRHLSAGEMLVGQALTLLYLDPATVEHGGTITREQVLSQLAGAMGAETLLRAMNPKRRRFDERVAEETTRTKVSEAIRRLATLGFVDLVDETAIRLRSPLMRFAEPVRGSGPPEVALERLVAEGELVLQEDGGGGEDEGTGEDDGAHVDDPPDDEREDAGEARDDDAFPAKPDEIP